MQVFSSFTATRSVSVRRGLEQCRFGHLERNYAGVVPTSQYIHAQQLPTRIDTVSVNVKDNAGQSTLSFYWHSCHLAQTTKCRFTSSALNWLVFPAATTAPLAIMI